MKRRCAQGTAAFVVVFPDDFERDVVRGRRPDILVVADASDPTAVGGAVGALSGIVQTAMAETFSGALAQVAPAPPPFGVAVHKQYNPEGRTTTNIVPGLLAIILSMTMVMMTAVAIVKETEKGTMEMLIATPVKPLEVMLGKILPYVFVGYVQTIVFLIAGLTIFRVPFDGSWFAFFIGFNLFIVVNLALGFLISAAARSQMQAIQLSVFTILPSVLLSGFLFPFAAMPGWAQVLGNIVPATHFVRIVRSVMLKGGDIPDVAPEFIALSGDPAGDHDDRGGAVSKDAGLALVRDRCALSRNAERLHDSDGRLEGRIAGLAERTSRAARATDRFLWRSASCPLARATTPRAWAM